VTGFGINLRNETLNVLVKVPTVPNTPPYFDGTIPSQYEVECNKEMKVSLPAMVD
jgi:hypothetical protein